MATGWPMKTTYANGDVYSASDVNDTNGTINLLGSSVAYAAGKNVVINSDFNVWQRGTSFSNPTSNSYTSDRWVVQHDGTAATRTISRQAFTPGTAPVAGYEGNFFYRYAISAAGVGNTINVLTQRIENVTTYAGQTVTLSFWAKADAARTLSTALGQDFGSGGSGGAATAFQSSSVTTSWQRFSLTYSVPSIAGKTIGTSSYLYIYITMPSNVVETIDFWGMQLEAGSTATAFQTATGTIQGELAACQRYYFRTSGTSAYQNHAIGFATNTTDAYFFISAPVQMRVVPTAIDYTSQQAHLPGISNTVFGTVSISSDSDQQNPTIFAFGASGLTTNRPYFLANNNNAAGYIGLSAEL
jgi:hypothetical protein